MKVKKAANGQYYLHNSNGNKTTKQNVFLIRNPCKDRKSGRLDIKHIYFPEELVGKRVMLKVEVVDND